MNPVDESYTGAIISNNLGRVRSSVKHVLEQLKQDISLKTVAVDRLADIESKLNLYSQKFADVSRSKSVVVSRHAKTDIELDNVKAVYDSEVSTLKSARINNTKDVDDLIKTITDDELDRNKAWENRTGADKAEKGVVEYHANSINNIRYNLHSNLDYYYNQVTAGAWTLESVKTYLQKDTANMLKFITRLNDNLQRARFQDVYKTHMQLTDLELATEQSMQHIEVTKVSTSSKALADVNELLAIRDAINPDMKQYRENIWNVLQLDSLITE